MNFFVFAGYLIWTATTHDKKKSHPYPHFLLSSPTLHRTSSTASKTLLFNRTSTEAQKVSLNGPREACRILSRKALLSMLIPRETTHERSIHDPRKISYPERYSAPKEQEHRPMTRERPTEYYPERYMLRKISRYASTSTHKAMLSVIRRSMKQGFSPHLFWETGSNPSLLS